MTFTVPAPLACLHTPTLPSGPSHSHPPLHVPPDQAWTAPHLHRATYTAGAQALGFRSGQAREGSGPSRSEAAEAEGGPAQTLTSPVTQQDITNTPRQDGHLGFFAPSPHFTDGLTEAKTGPDTKPLSSKEEGPGLEARQQSLSQPRWAAPYPRPGTSGVMVKTGYASHHDCGPGTVTQLTSGAMNTPACPTAPTCPTWLPFLLLSRPGARGQDAWVCAENQA